MIDFADGGWKSRKLWFSFFTSMLIVAVALYGGSHPSIAILYPEMVMGLIGVASLFFGANSFSKWASRGTPSQPAKPAAPVDEPKEDDHA